MKIAYTAEAVSTGGRNGVSATKDGKLAVKLTTPKELGGPGGDGVNPEQLFAMGYSACFIGALKHVASQEKVALSGDVSAEATVGIGPRDDGQGFGLEVRMVLTVPGVERAVAEDLVAKAHVVCPYSHATKGNIKVDVVIA